MPGNLLEEFLFGEKKKRSELEVLADVEIYLSRLDFEEASRCLDELESDQNLFVALQMILSKMITTLREGVLSEGDLPEMLKVLEKVMEKSNLIVVLNYRVTLLTYLAVLFYLLGDEFRGDMALKTALSLAGDRKNLLKFILRTLFSVGLLKKAGYVLSKIGDSDLLNLQLVELTKVFYQAGEKRKAFEVIKHIEKPYYKALAYLALAELEKQSELAKAYLKAAEYFASLVKESNASTSIMMRIKEYEHKISGDVVSVQDILNRPSETYEWLWEQGGKRL